MRRATGHATACPVVVCVDVCSAFTCALRLLFSIVFVPAVSLITSDPSHLVAHFAGSRALAFTIRSSRIQGKGAFASRRIKKGERIIEYLGECIDEAESDIRYPDDEMGRHHTFLFSIGDGSRVLDAGPLEWPAKYINHSCDPNCEAIEEEDGRVFISALHAIESGTELSYDYAYERTPEHTEADEKLYVCRCGSPKCRGTIMAPPKVKKSKDKKRKKDKRKKRKERKEEKRRRRAEDAAAEAVPQVDATDLPLAHAARTHVPKAPGRKAGGKKRGAQTRGDNSVVAKKTGVKKTGAKKTGAKTTGTKKTGAKKTGTKKTGTKKTGVTKRGARKRAA
jgi:uncharacterized protein